MKNFDFKNIDFKNITPEQKKKIFVGGGLILVVAGFIWISVPKDEDKKADDYNLPHNSEVENYNSKTDALNKKATENSGDDLGEMYKSDSTKVESVDFESLDKQMAEAKFNAQSTNVNPQSQSNPNTYSQSNTSNAHNVYGDYDMWQNREPANSKIGYTNKKGGSGTTSTVSPHKTKLPQDVYSEPEPAIIPQQNNTVSNPVYQEKKSFSNNQIQAKLITTGQAVDGTKLTFILLEPAKIAGIETKKGQPIQGIAKEENGRLFVNIQTIKINNKIYPVNVKLLGDDGIEGLSIGGRGTRNKVGETARSAGEDAAGTLVRSIPIVGGVLGGALNKNRSAGGQEPINLSSNIRAIIMIY